MLIVDRGNPEFPIVPFPPNYRVIGLVLWHAFDFCLVVFYLPNTRLPNTIH